MKTNPNPVADKARQRRPSDESGVALIMVLGVLAAAMLLIAHLMTVSEILSKEAMVTVRKSELRYQAESAADITYWMYLTDRRLFSSRKLVSKSFQKPSAVVAPVLVLIITSPRRPSRATPSFSSLSV